MPSTIDSDHRAYLATGSVALALALRITRQDGTVIGFTTAQRNVTLPTLVLGGVTVPGATYLAGEWLTPSNLQTTDDCAQADNWEGTFALGGQLSDGDVRKHLWTDAEFTLIEYVRSNLAWQQLRQTGRVGGNKLSGQRATLKMRSLASLLEQDALELTSPLHRSGWDGIVGYDVMNLGVGVFALGDDTVDGFATQVTGMVSARIGDREFTVAATVGWPLRRFAGGTVEFTGGANDGLIADVMDWDEASGELTLWLPMSRTVADGDAVLVTVKAPATEDEWIVYFGDLAYFDGEPGITSLEAASQEAA